MAARIFIYANHEDFSELAAALRAFADIADGCADSLKENATEHHTDGFNSAIEGIDSVANLLIGIVGSFNAKRAELTSLRAKISDERARIAVAKIAKVADVEPPALRVAEPAAGYPHPAKKVPAGQRPKANRKKKA